MYFLPMPMRCPKCGHTGNYSIHATPGPVLDDSVICPECYKDMIREHCGVMQQFGESHE
jgi:predicted RNA-binding Zn-ribbon protein involved in translation (DUF1610 family)